MGCRIKSRVFDNSVREVLRKEKRPSNSTTTTATYDGAAIVSSLQCPIPGSAAYARQHPTGGIIPPSKEISGPAAPVCGHPADAPNSVNEENTGTASEPTTTDFATIVTFQDAL